MAPLVCQVTVELSREEDRTIWTLLSFADHKIGRKQDQKRVDVVAVIARVATRLEMHYDTYSSPLRKRMMSYNVHQQVVISAWINENIGR